jgi:hypothetical protein
MRRLVSRHRDAPTKKTIRNRLVDVVPSRMPFFMAYSNSKSICLVDVFDLFTLTEQRCGEVEPNM